METINILVSKHIPRLRRGIIHALSFNIYMVGIGVKPSLLIDTINVKTHLIDLIKLLQEINAGKFLSFVEPIHIVAIKDDYFLINLEESVKRLKKEKHYVDVSHCLPQPRIIKNFGTKYKSIQCMIQNVTDQLNKFLSTKSEVKETIELKSTWNITTLFGILLDYPVVYWYEDIDDVKTCLSCKDLVNYNIINTTATKSDSSSNSVFSFTIPKNVIDSTLEMSVEAWTILRYETAEANNIRLTCEKKHVNMSTVLL